MSVWAALAASTLVAGGAIAMLAHEAPRPRFRPATAVSQQQLCFPARTWAVFMGCPHPKDRTEVAI